jgi:hypothetical protein
MYVILLQSYSAVIKHRLETLTIPDEAANRLGLLKHQKATSASYTDEQI